MVKITPKRSNFGQILTKIVYFSAKMSINEVLQVKFFLGFLRKHA